MLSMNNLWYNYPIKIIYALYIDQLHSNIYLQTSVICNFLFLFLFLSILIICKSLYSLLYFRVVENYVPIDNIDIKIVHTYFSNVCTIKYTLFFLLKHKSVSKYYLITLFKAILLLYYNHNFRVQIYINKVMGVIQRYRCCKLYRCCNSGKKLDKDHRCRCKCLPYNYKDSC